MSLFAIADVHLSLGADKPMDIFHGWQDYVQRLENNWRRVVTPADTVVIPGDISWAMRLSDALEDFRFLNDLPGEKIFLKGNHDLWWDTMKKMNAFLASNDLTRIQFLHNNAYQVGTIAVCGSRGWSLDEDTSDRKVLLREVGRLETSLKAAAGLEGERVVFMHYPPVCTDKQCDEIVDLLHRYGVTRCYYGHLHGPALYGAVNGCKDGIRYRVLSGDALQFCPFLIEKF